MHGEGENPLSFFAKLGCIYKFVLLIIDIKNIFKISMGG